ncbi:hypothetical protein F4803DRAFT_568080 [Xylaria telfairii]|nr:hypothetical protein F4803DRAFT_568080 [Xylaria telfairii]
MHSNRVLLSLVALAGTSLSQKSDSEFCSSYVNSLFSTLFETLPTTPPAIASFLAQNTRTTPPATITASPTTTVAAAPSIDFEGHAEELCSVLAELPSSLIPEFQSYAGVFLSVGRAHSSEYIAYITDCEPETEIASMTSRLDYYFTATGNPCETTPAPGGASNGTYSTSHAATATSSYANITSSATSAVTAAAARPTGALLGAAAIGGVLGAVALL